MSQTLETKIKIIKERAIILSWGRGGQTTLRESQFNPRSCCGNHPMTLFLIHINIF
jgi:hypothetical protein